MNDNRQITSSYNNCNSSSIKQTEYHNSLSENKCKQKDRQIIASGRRAEKNAECKGDTDTTCGWSNWNGLQRPRKRIGEIGY